MGDRHVVQVFLQLGVAGGSARREIGGAGNKSAGVGHGRVVVGGGVAVAYRFFPIIGHAILIGVGRCRAGDQGAEPAVGGAGSTEGPIGDAVAALGDEVVGEDGVELVPEGAARIRIEPQRAAGGDDFFVSEQRAGIFGHGRARSAGDRAGEQVHIRQTAAENAAAAVGAVEDGVLVAVVKVVADKHGEVRIAVAVLAGAGKRASRGRTGDKVTAHDVGFPIGRSLRIAENEADVPVEGHVVHPVQQTVRPRLGIAGVIVRPERMVDGGAVHIPEAAGRVTGQSPGVVGPLESQIVRRGIEAGEVFVVGEHGVAVVEYRKGRCAVDIHGVARTPVTEADEAEHVVIAGDTEGLVFQPEAIPGSRLASDGNLVGGHPQRARNGGVATHVENDGAARRGDAGGESVGERSCSRAVGVHNVIDVAAAASRGMGGESFRAGEGGNLRVEQGRRQEHDSENEIADRSR